jgi:hypothetical protein
MQSTEIIVQMLLPQLNNKKGKEDLQSFVSPLCHVKNCNEEKDKSPYAKVANTYIRVYVLGYNVSNKHY